MSYILIMSLKQKLNIIICLLLLLLRLIEQDLFNVKSKYVYK